MEKSFERIFTEDKYPERKFAVSTFSTRKRSRFLGNSIISGIGISFYKAHLSKIFPKRFLEERISIYGVEFVFAQFVLAITWSRTKKLSKE